MGQRYLLACLTCGVTIDVSFQRLAAAHTYFTKAHTGPTHHILLSFAPKDALPGDVLIEPDEGEGKDGLDRQ